MEMQLGNGDDFNRRRVSRSEALTKCVRSIAGHRREPFRFPPESTASDREASTTGACHHQHDIHKRTKHQDRYGPELILVALVRYPGPKYELPRHRYTAVPEDTECGTSPRCPEAVSKPI